MDHFEFRRGGVQYFVYHSNKLENCCSLETFCNKASISCICCCCRLNCCCCSSACCCKCCCCEAFELQTALVVSVVRLILAREELLLLFLLLRQLDIWLQRTAEHYNQIFFSSFSVLSLRPSSSSELVIPLDFPHVFIAPSLTAIAFFPSFF